MNYTIREKVDNGGTVGWFRHFLGRVYAARMMRLLNRHAI
jgi:hypothetical protein